MISRVLSDMEKTGKSNATINNVRALASVIFSKGIEWGTVSDNPVRKIKTRKKSSRDRFLQAHELPRFFASLVEEPNQIIRNFFLISLLTGARRSNVLEMRWSELYLDESIWRITRTKNGDPQNVTLCPEAVTLLRQLKENADAQAVYVFPGAGSTGHLVEPRKGWARIFDRDELKELHARITEVGEQLNVVSDPGNDESSADSLEINLERARAQAKTLNLNVENARIPGLRIHDLRRTLGSWQAKTGASLAIIGKSLNHKSPQATVIYARLDLDPVRASVDKATSAMLDAAGLKDILDFAKPALTE